MPYCTKCDHVGQSDKGYAFCHTCFGYLCIQCSINHDITHIQAVEHACDVCKTSKDVKWYCDITSCKLYLCYDCWWDHDRTHYHKITYVYHGDLDYMIFKCTKCGFMQMEDKKWHECDRVGYKCRNCR